MARPTRDEIETYKAITGASDSLALEKLEEHGGNLSQAVNAFYSEEEDTQITNNPPSTGYPIPQHNAVPLNNNESESVSKSSSLISTARAFKPSLLLDSNYRRDLYRRIGFAGSSLLSPGVSAQDPNDRHVFIGPRPNVGNYIRTGHIPTGNESSGLDNDNVEDEILQSVIRDSLSDAPVSDWRAEREMERELDDLSHAMLLSMQSYEKEEAIRAQQMKDIHQELGFDGKSETGSSSKQNKDKTVEEEDSSRFEMWGGISFEKLDEARSLEAAFFSSSSGVKSNDILSRHPQAKRFIKEEEDEEFCATTWPGKQKREESHQEVLIEVEQERSLADKIASLSHEPDPDDENAVTLDVRMPNGNRTGRCFLKSDKLQLLFDFIDVDGAKPGTYRLVRHFPRRVFNSDDSALTLTELGLTTKQEVLFLELI